MGDKVIEGNLKEGVAKASIEDSPVTQPYMIPKMERSVNKGVGRKRRSEPKKWRRVKEPANDKAGSGEAGGNEDGSAIEAKGARMGENIKRQANKQHVDS